MMMSFSTTSVQNKPKDLFEKYYSEEKVRRLSKSKQGI